MTPEKRAFSSRHHSFENKKKYRRPSVEAEASVNVGFWNNLQLKLRKRKKSMNLQAPI